MGRFTCELARDGEFRCTTNAKPPADARLAPDANGTAPDTAIDQKPPAATRDLMAMFTFTSTIPGSTFQCAFGPMGSPGAFTACTSPGTFTVTEGQRTIHVRAVSPAGVQDGTPATYTWVVDRTGPTVTITSGPPAVDAASDVRFVFTANEPGPFTCQMDSNPTVQCTSPRDFSQLSEGPHLWKIFATDALGNVGPTVEYPFNVSIILPDTMATCPEAVVRSSTASVSFVSDQSPATFACSIDGGDFASCSSPASFPNLGEGLHSIQVRASAGGLTDPNPATCQFEVNAVAPTVQITSPAAGADVGTTAQFSYIVTPPETGLTFTCRAGSLNPACDETGRVTVSGLPLGPLTFEVTVRDSVGNTSTDTINVNVVEGPPTNITITPFFQGRTSGTPMFLFSVVGDVQNPTFSCNFNGTITENCQSPIQMSLAHGTEIIFEVTATVNGQKGPTARATATVDALAPTISDVAPMGLNGTSVVAFFSSSDTTAMGTVFTCNFDGQTVSPCEPGVPLIFTSLFNGPHMFFITATDAVGNMNQFASPFEVDGLGPVFDPELNVAPTQAVCPSSTEGNQITFFAEDERGSDPVRYTCALDVDPDHLDPSSNDFDTCSPSNPEDPKFNWFDLEEGEHVLAVVAYDRFNNPSEPNIITFFVDRTPPVVTIVVEGEATELAAINATAGSFVGGQFGRFFITLEEGDNGDPDGLPDHPPLVVTGCSISNDGNDDLVNCLDTCNQLNDDGTEWECFWADDVSDPSLDDDNNMHHVTIVAEDDCGPVNESEDTADWLVDSTADSIALLAFLEAGNAEENGIFNHTEAGDLVAVNNDITDGTATVQFHHRRPGPRQPLRGCVGSGRRVRLFGVPRRQVLRARRLQREHAADFGRLRRGQRQHRVLHGRHHECADRGSAQLQRLVHRRRRQSDPRGDLQLLRRSHGPHRGHHRRAKTRAARSPTAPVATAARAARPWAGCRSPTASAR
jgi:hypothetical protein